MTRFARSLLGIALLASAGLVACGGGSSFNPSSTATPTPAPSSGDQLASAQFAITVPSTTTFTPSPSSAAAKRRAPKYVSTGTLSIVITLQSVNGGAPPGAALPTLLTVGGASCAPGGDGQTCTVTVAGYAGIDVYAVTTYATANGTGTPLSSGTISATLTAGTTTMVAVTDVMSQSLAPVATAIVLALSTSFLNGAGTAQLAVNETDASGAYVLGTNFGGPVTVSVPSGSTGLTLTGANGTPSASVAVTTSSVLTITYSGSGAISPAVFLASAAGFNGTALAASASLPLAVPATPTPLPTATPAPTPTPTSPPIGDSTPTPEPPTPVPDADVQANVTEVDVNSIGGTSQFVVNQLNNTTFTVSTANPAVATATVDANGNVTVTGLAVGTTSVTITGNGGAPLTLPVKVSSTTIIINGVRRR